MTTNETKIKKSTALYLDINLLINQLRKSNQNMIEVEVKLCKRRNRIACTDIAFKNENTNENILFVKIQNQRYTIRYEVDPKFDVVKDIFIIYKDFQGEETPQEEVQIKGEFRISDDNLAIIKKVVNSALKNAPTLMGWNCMSRSTFTELNRILLLSMKPEFIKKEEIPNINKVFKTYSRGIDKYNRITKI